LRLAADAQRAEERGEAEQRSVRAKVTAPKVFDEERRNGQDDQNDDRGLAEIAEEVEHLHRGDDAVVAAHERGDGVGGHRGDGPGEESEQQILQAAERDINPFPEDEIAAEKPYSQAAEILGNGTDRAEPTAKRFAKQECHGQERDEQEHRGGMDGRDLAGYKEISQ